MRDTSRETAAKRGDEVEALGYPAVAAEVREGVPLATVTDRVVDTMLEREEGELLPVLQRFADEDRGLRAAASTVYVVHLVEEDDGLYVFETEELADRFADACEDHGRDDVVRTSEPTFDEVATAQLIDGLGDEEG